MQDQLLFTNVVLLGFAIAVIFFITWAIPVRLWIEAISAGVHVGIGTLVGMRLRKVSPPSVVRPLITATKAGLDLDINALEAHYLAGGRVDRVVGALISADKANIDLTFNRAAAIDLAGRDVTTLSGGEMQRTAIARALVHKPALLLADEPTGNLDSHTGAQIMALLKELSGESQTTMLLVTHSEEVASHAGRILRLSDGRLVTDHRP